MSELETFIKKKEYLICVDSDGCAIDTMDIKHKKCFGPCMIEEWNLQEWEEKILTRWNEINLYSMTRGINRFKGLEMALREIDEQITKIEDLSSLTEWVNETKELSNQSLKNQIEKNNSLCLKKALSWSENLNKRITELSIEEKQPFKGVKEALEKAHMYADIAIVSSANYEAVVEEWSEHGLLDYVDILLSQNVGSKAYCISELLKKGYSKDHALMIGDAPGDEKAADDNGVFFYPILVKNEDKSWEEFSGQVLETFTSNHYQGQALQYKKMFHDNLVK